MNPNNHPEPLSPDVKQFVETLGIDAREYFEERDGNFAETIAKTDAMLKRAATVSLVEQRPTPNALDFTLQIASSTGHKLPTSYPSRRAILHVTVTNSLNQVVFESGKVKADGSVVGVDADEQNGVFEPHYDLITSADQVQVYEAIMGNNLGDVTYTLLRGKEYLKDNRILPLGFNKATAPADVRVVGEALADSNFIGGSDQISYRISGLPAGNYRSKPSWFTKPCRMRLRRICLPTR